MVRSLALFTLAGLLFATRCPAQDQLTLAFAKQVQADVALLTSHQTLGAWQNTHRRERPEAAGYKPDNRWPESDFSSLPSRCALSVGHEPSETTHVAVFLVPRVVPGQLPPLPPTANAALMQSCQLEEMWVETRSPVSFNSLIRVLVSSWGEPNGPSQSFHDAVPLASFRKNATIWNRKGMTIWVVNQREPGSPVAVYARNDIPAQKDRYDRVDGFQTKVAEQSAPTLAKIAALDPSLTKAVLARTSCASGSPTAEAPDVTAERLERWLKASKTLPPSRRASALLIADYYMFCSARAPETNELKERYVRMGASFFGGCPQEPEYGHNFRKQAEQIDRLGVAGELASLGSFWDKCSIAYGNVVEVGENLAKKFPAWRPYIRYALARSHDATLSRYYPGGSPEEDLFGGPPRVPPAQIERERTAAIRDFTNFLREEPADPEAPFAWQEVWRLQAGLKPTRLTFGCSCE